MSQRNQIITVSVLGVLLVGVLGYQLTRGAGTPPSSGAAQSKPASAAPAVAGGAAAQPAAAPTAAPAEATAEPDGSTIRQSTVKIDELLANIKDVEFDYAAEKMPRDPMAPLIGMVNAMNDPNAAIQGVAAASVGQVLNKEVSGIVWDPVAPVAVVDNEVVYPGFEYADGTVVMAIERDRVIFKVGDSPVPVKLKEL